MTRETRPALAGSYVRTRPALASKLTHILNRAHLERPLRMQVVALRHDPKHHVGVAVASTGALDTSPEPSDHKSIPRPAPIVPMRREVTPATG